MLEQHSLEGKIIAYTDNNPLKWNLPFQRQNLMILSPDEIIKRYGKDICIIIASSAFTEIRKQLLLMGMNIQNVYLYNFAFMELEYTDKEFIWDCMEKFQQAYERFTDEKSQEIFVNILNYRITKDQKYLERMQEYVDDEKKQYFDEKLFAFSADEIFLDLGAYTGDTLERFDKLYQGNWEKYYGIEADKKVFAELEKCIAGKEYAQKVHLIQMAAWDKREELYFTQCAGNSIMEINKSEDKESVFADCMDNVLITEKVTFIKMDIEGAESRAITGMRKIIQRNKPIMAVCVYHKREDFFVLTDLIEEICPCEYSFYIRQYRYTPTETVCYAIPQYRIKQQGDILS